MEGDGIGDDEETMTFMRRDPGGGYVISTSFGDIGVDEEAIEMFVAMTRLSESQLKRIRAIVDAFSENPEIEIN